MPVNPPELAPEFIDLIKGDVPVGLAVSGGGDSVALLHLVARLGGRVTVASVDHGLRAEAASECAMVAQICAGYGMSHQVLHWTGWDGSGNLQDQARRARYRLLADWAQASGVTDVALGHTADDQAETLIMALARGAGVDGLAGMAATTVKSRIRFHRPLLHATRQQLRAYLTAGGHRWCDDPSNDDAGFERIRVRQAAQMFAQLGLTPTSLGQVARHMAAAAQALGQQHDDLTGALLRQHGDMLVTIPLRDMATEPARRLVLAAMGWVNRNLAAPRRDKQMRLMQALRNGQATTLAGCLFGFDGPVLRISRELQAVTDHVTTTKALWDRRWRLTGPHDASLQLRALGAGITECADWRLAGLPHASLKATPAVWRDDRLICAPLAGFGTGWTAQIVAE